MTNLNNLEMTNVDITNQMAEVIGGENGAPNLGPVPWADKMIVGRWYRSEYNEKELYYLEAQLSDTEYKFLMWSPLGPRCTTRWVGPYVYKSDGFKMYEVPRKKDFPTV